MSEAERLAGAIAYQLTTRLVIDMPTARAAVDAAMKEVGRPKPEEPGVAMARYKLSIFADSGYRSTTEGRCNVDQYSAALRALDVAAIECADLRRLRRTKDDDCRRALQSMLGGRIMTPEYIDQLADFADPDRLWALSYLDQMKLPPEERRKLDTGVALRRHASHLRHLNSVRAEGKSLLITPLSPNSTTSCRVDPPEEHRRLMTLNVERAKGSLS